MKVAEFFALDLPQDKKVSRVKAASFHPLQNKIAIGFRRDIYEYDLISGSRVAQYTTESEITHLEHAHTHNVLVAALKNGCFSALDLTSHTLTAFHVPIKSSEKRPVSYFAISRTRPFMFYVRDKGLAVSGIEMFADSKNRVEYTHRKQISCITVHPKKNVMASASIDGNIRIWNTESHQIVASFEEYGTDKNQRSAVTTLCFFSNYGSSKGNTQHDLLVTGTRSGKLQIWYITPTEQRVVATLKTNEWIVNAFFHATLPCLMVLNHKGCLKAISIGHLITNFNSGSVPAMKGILTKFEMVDAFYIPLHDTSYATTQKNLKSIVPAIDAKINENSGLIVFFGKNYQISNLNTPNVRGVIVSEYFPIFNTVDVSEFPASTLPICTTFPFNLETLLANPKIEDYELPISELLYLDTFTATPHDILMKYNLASNSSQRLQLIKTSPSLAEFHRCVQIKCNKAQNKLLIFYQKQAQLSSYNNTNRSRFFLMLDLTKRAEIPPPEPGVDGDFYEGDNSSNMEYIVLDEEGRSVRIYEFGDNTPVGTIKLDVKVSRIFSCPFKKDLVLYYTKSHSLLAFANSDLSFNLSSSNALFQLRQNEIPISVQWQKVYPQEQSCLIGLLTTHRVLILDQNLKIRASVESPLQTRKSLYFQSCLWLGTVLLYNTCTTVYGLCPNLLTESPGAFSNFPLCTLEHANSVLSGVLFDRIFFTCYRNNCPQMSVRYINIIEPLLLSIISLNEPQEAKCKWIQSVVSKFDCRSVSERTLLALERTGFADLASDLITHSVYDFSWELRFRLALQSLQFAYAYEILLAQYQRSVVREQVDGSVSTTSPGPDRGDFGAKLAFMEEEYCAQSSPYYSFFTEIAEKSLEHGQYVTAAKCYDVINDSWSLLRIFSMFCSTPAVLPLSRLAMRCKYSPDLYSIYMACRVVLGDAYNEQEEADLYRAIFVNLGKKRLSLELYALDNVEWLALPDVVSKTAAKRNFDLGTSFKVSMKLKSEKKAEVESALPSLAVAAEKVEPISLYNFSQWMGYISTETKKSENDWDKVDFTGEFGRNQGRPMSDDESSGDTISVQPKKTTKIGSRPSLPTLDLPSVTKTLPTSTDDSALETERDADDETDMMSDATTATQQVDEEGFAVRPDIDAIRKEYAGGSSSDNSSDSDGGDDKYKKKKKLFRKLRIKDQSEAIVPASKVDISSFKITGPAHMSAAPVSARSKRARRGTLRATDVPVTSTTSTTDTTSSQDTDSSSPTPSIAVNNEPVAPVAMVNPAEALKTAMALMEQGKYREAKNSVNDAISSLVNDNTEVLKKTNLLLCVRYKLLILMLANNQRLESKPGPTQVKDLARNSFLLSQIKVVTKHQVICRNMARRRNLQANNMGCTAIVTRQLLPLTPPQHRPEIEKCLGLCEEQGFKNEDQELGAAVVAAEQELRQLNEDQDFLPMQFCWRTFELFSPNLKEYLLCPYCDAKYAPNEEAKILPDKLCSFCSYGSLERKERFY